MPMLLFDSDNPVVLVQPMLKGCLVATYADLVSPQLVQELPGRLVVIDRGHGDPMRLATVVDIERGTYTVPDGVKAAREMLAAGRPAVTVYHNRSTWAAVDAELAGAPVHHWVATLDSTANPNGTYPSVVQLLAESNLGFHADASVVWDHSWHPLAGGVPTAAISAVKLAQAASLSASARLERAIAAL